MFGPEVIDRLFLERRQHRSLNVFPAHENRSHIGIDFIFDVEVLLDVSVEWYFHLSFLVVGAVEQT
jgi:hypothetical protein